MQVWDKGVDTVSFNPSFRSEEMRKRLSGGRDGPIIGCVGRLGAKRLGDLKDILEKLPPNVNLAIIGDGPERQNLEKHFAASTYAHRMITEAVYPRRTRPWTCSSCRAEQKRSVSSSWSRWLPVFPSSPSLPVVCF